MTTSIMWFRRDLRLGDNPALLSAAAAADRVLPLFVLDPHLVGSGDVQTRRLLASLSALRQDMGGTLVIRSGDPVEVISSLASQIGAREVHLAAGTTPYGRQRDESVAARLAGIGAHLFTTGSPYAVTPGRIRTGAGTSYRVFTPFFRAWQAHGWRCPAEKPEVSWHDGVRSDPLDASELTPMAGERAALEGWETFLDTRLTAYADGRDRADLDVTSRMSIALKYGEVHPRTLLADLAHRQGADDLRSVERYITELAWREFYADVLWHDPASAWQDWREELRGMRYDDSADAIQAWRQGQTGYPYVDAGMRQLLAEGWMHNRPRMVTASFLVKDLHVWWPVGARHFLAHLADGDVASNNHGWQWVAGTGTDAAPYFRIFNPVAQGLRFDPQGDYVRRWIPELRHLAGPTAHEPWRQPDGYAHGYPGPIIDHAEERREALLRLAETKQGT